MAQLILFAAKAELRLEINKRDTNKESSKTITIKKDKIKMKQK